MFLTIIIITFKYKRVCHAYQIAPLFSLEAPGFIQEYLVRVATVRLLSFCKIQQLTSLTLEPSAFALEVLGLHLDHEDPRT